MNNMIIKDYKPFNGQHCETTAIGSLLLHLGIELSEPMIFGLGEGLGFVYWKMKNWDFPFLGGRVKQDVLTENVCRNLNLELEVKQTTSMKKAWGNVKDYLDNGIPVGLKLDCYHLEYFTTKIHFAAHYASIYGYDDHMAYLNDTNQQGRAAITSLESLALARNEKGPMSSRNRSFVIRKNDKIPDLKIVTTKALLNNAQAFLSPPIKNLGYKGMLKASSEIQKWFDSSTSIETEFQTVAMLMERAGTGGALFRNLYRDFLKESAEILVSDKILAAHNEYAKIAELWTEVSELFVLVSKIKDRKHITEASSLLIELAEKERQTMEKIKIAIVN